jgi:hypothetical protein
MEVRLPLINKRPDPEIVREIIAGLKAELPMRRTTSRRSSGTDT